MGVLLLFLGLFGGVESSEAVVERPAVVRQAVPNGPLVPCKVISVHDSYLGIYWAQPDDGSPAGYFAGPAGLSPSNAFNGLPLPNPTDQS